MNDSSRREIPRHARMFKSELDELADRLRAATTKETEPKAQALYETAAEVLIGLAKAFEDYEKKNEEAWKEE